MQKIKSQKSRSCVFSYLLYDLIIAVDISLDADTAHPRLEVSEDGKSVKDIGMIRKVPMREKRFDSHLFVLAKEGYTSGRFYWEVNVGKRRNWTLGVAQESVTRKGTVTLSPNNGFWVIGLVDGQEYWAYMDPWTHLAVTGTLQKIGIFLDISTKQLSFYNVHKKTILCICTKADHCSGARKLSGELETHFTRTNFTSVLKFALVT
uniref:B30.2/SPRY domain-containing protein n=1 Tax=Anas platyrhynchos TaxID=8839 RepID=A0A8B9T0Q6_ANAPL